jgi:MATE family multidrug resistance protein
MNRAMPAMLAFFLEMNTTIITMYFAGQISNQSTITVLAGVSMSTMFVNVSCLSLLYGMSSGIETLASQHYGARNYREVGLVLYRSCIILGFMLLPIAVIWYMSEDIFSMLGVPADVCDVIGNFLKIRILSMPAEVFNISYEQYVVAIGVNAVTVYVSIITTCMQIILNIIFVYILQLSYQYLAWSLVINSYIATFAFIIISSTYKEVLYTRQSFHMDVFNKHAIYEFITLGIPGCLQMCSDWWAFEILIIFAATLGPEDTTAQSILFQVVCLCFMFPIGIGVASGSLVGNTLGAGYKNTAQRITQISLYVTTLITILLVVPMVYYYGIYFVQLYNVTDNVINICMKTLPVIILFLVSDSIQCVIGYVLRGAGLQRIGAITNLIAYYVIGLPLAYYLCFHMNLGVYGLNLGIATGNTLQFIILAWYIYRFRDSVFKPIIDSEYGNKELHMNRDNELVLKGYGKL